MNVGLKALADHADGIADADLRIEQKFLRQHVEDDTIFRERDTPRRFDGVSHIFAVNIARTIADGDAAAAGDAVNVSASHADDGALDRHAGDAFSDFERVANRAGHGFEIHDQAFANALGFRGAHR